MVKTATRKAAASDPRAARVAARQRRLQDQEKAKDARAAKKATKKTATQAGARRQPEAMPAQQLAKPGHEHELELAPRFLAPDYTGSGKLQGMRAIVTGGDSGIGRAVAVLFAREGADVAVLHLDEAEDADITRQHVEREGGRCVVIAGDVRDPRFCDKAVKQVAKAFGGIDILVNNAAFQLHCERLEDLEDAHLQETLQTNIGGYIQMARAVLPHLGEGASIINTGSETGIFGSKALIDYSATRARSTRSPNRSPASCCRAASGSTAWRLGRYGRRSTRPTSRRRTWRNLARTATWTGLHSPRNCRRPTCSGLAGLCQLHQRGDPAGDGWATRVNSTTAWRLLNGASRRCVACVNGCAGAVG